jgi:hypothetical protein
MNEDSFLKIITLVGMSTAAIGVIMVAGLIVYIIIRGLRNGFAC